MTPRGRIVIWGRRAVLGGSVTLGLLLGFGFALQTVASARALRDHPPLGRRYDVGGYKLNLYCLGSGPTVVLFGGFPEGVIDWADTIQPALARSTRACSYDPPGFGWSDPAPSSQEDAPGIARAVHCLLVAAGEKGPYTLVGHSLGGIYARQFAALYPDETAGMVLIDSSSESMIRRLPAKTTASQLQQLHLLRYIRYLTPFGIQHVLRVPMATTNLRTPKLRAIASTMGYRTAGYFAAYDQLSRLLTASESGQLQTPKMPPIPLFVLTSTDSIKTYGPTWAELQDELVALSPRSHHMTVDSAHDIQREHPTVVLAAIATVIAGEQRL